MATCDMCGKEAVYRALVEGAEVNVCEGCSRYGKIIEKVRVKKEPKIRKIGFVKKEKRAEPEITQIIVPNYAQLIRTTREKKGLKQEELAKAVSEKESLIHSLEVGKYEPSIKIAKKLERFLKIKLIEEPEEKGDIPLAKKGEGFTIGDIINVRRR